MHAYTPGYIISLFVVNGDYFKFRGGHIRVGESSQFYLSIFVDNNYVVGPSACTA